LWVFPPSHEKKVTIGRVKQATITLIIQKIHGL
jgi:hypothetical protein